MVTFKESFTDDSRVNSNNMIIDMDKRMVCKLLFDNNYNFYINNSRIYILSTTTNPFLFTFKTI
jgi:hypothetical protein